MQLDLIIVLHDLLLNTVYISLVVLHKGNMVVVQGGNMVVVQGGEHGCGTRGNMVVVQGGNMVLVQGGTWLWCKGGTWFWYKGEHGYGTRGNMAVAQGVAVDPGFLEGGGSNNYIHKRGGYWRGRAPSRNS